MSDSIDSPPSQAVPGMSRSSHSNSHGRVGSVPQQSQQSSVPTAMSKRARAILSVALVLHLVAIASAPLAMEPSSLLGQKLFGVFRPYLELFYLNHGYHFFAPEPGPGHLIRYEIQMSDGSVMNGVFPDAEQQRPRLLYHRHFMLTEFANRLAVDPAQQDAIDRLARSFAEHLIHENNGERATLYLQLHYIPTPEQVAAGLPLNAPELYAERSLGTFSKRAAVAPPREQPVAPEVNEPQFDSGPPIPELAELQPRSHDSADSKRQSSIASERLSFVIEPGGAIPSQDLSNDSEASLGGREVIR